MIKATHVRAAIDAWESGEGNLARTVAFLRDYIAQCEKAETPQEFDLTTQQGRWAAVVSGKTLMARSGRHYKFLENGRLHTWSSMCGGWEPSITELPNDDIPYSVVLCVKPLPPAEAMVCLANGSVLWLNLRGIDCCNLHNGQVRTSKADPVYDFNDCYLTREDAITASKQ